MLALIAKGHNNPTIEIQISGTAYHSSKQKRAVNRHCRQFNKMSYEQGQWVAACQFSSLLHSNSAKFQTES